MMSHLPGSVLPGDSSVFDDPLNYASETVARVPTGFLIGAVVVVALLLFFALMRKLLIFAIAALVLAAAVGWWWFSGGQPFR